jgi:hypothetical protein
MAALQMLLWQREAPMADSVEKLRILDIVNLWQQPVMTRS